MREIDFTFSGNEDERGSLVALHGGTDIPFAIHRVFYIFGVGDGVRRGLHAHRREQALLLCIRGSCTVTLDDGVERVSRVLDDPRRGLFVDRLVWLEMDGFSPDSLLLALSSASYDPSDYIRDYDEFLRVRRAEAEGGTP